MNNADELQDYDLLQQLEQALWAEKTRYNLEFQEAVFAPDFFEFGSSGKIWQRQDLIFEKGNPIHCQLPLEAIKIRFLTKEVAQITYNSVLTTPQGLIKSHRSSIWTKQHNQWQIRFHQGTPFSNA